MGVRWVVIKVMRGAWPTVARMHVTNSRSAPCKLGCENGSDNMSQYLRCRRPWWVACFPRDFCSNSELLKLCFGSQWDHASTPDDSLVWSVLRLSLTHQWHAITSAHPGSGPQYLLCCPGTARARTGR
eukprot:5507430-Pyramimonas_sp.AAC.1